MFESNRSSGSTTRDGLLAINSITPEEPRFPLAETKKPVLGDAVVASLSLVNAALGAGVLAYPYAYMSAGLIPASLLTLMLGCLSFMALCSLMHAMSKARARVPDPSKVSSFGDLVREELGLKASMVLEVLIVLYGFGACVGYLEVLEDVADSVMGSQQSVLDALGLSRAAFQVITLCAATVPCFALSALRSISALKYSAAASVLAVLFVVGILVSQAITNPCQRQ